jgi:hypothetical protein
VLCICSKLEFEKGKIPKKNFLKFSILKPIAKIFAPGPYNKFYGAFEQNANPYFIPSRENDV